MEPVLDLTKEYGIVLDGGGARGAYQIGACLLYTSHPADLRTGYIVGACKIYAFDPKGNLSCGGDRRMLLCLSLIHI